jgi:hypothetical protein
MPIVKLADQAPRPAAPSVNPMSQRGIKPKSRMQPTPGSKTQRRKANKQMMNTVLHD